MRGEPFFVVGCPRSGTTLLAVLLDRHSRLCVAPETGFYDEIAPRLWLRGEKRLLGILREWRRLPELGLDAESVLGRLPERWNAGDVLAAILELHAERRGSARCGEKTPQHLRHVPAIQRHFPRAKILCMLRDGRDNALSLRAMPWWRGGLREAAMLWRRSARLAEQSARHGQFRIVRYEDLVARPAEVLRSIMTFLGETFQPAQIDTQVPSGVVLARSMEWKGDALGPMLLDRIDGRRREASPEDLALLERLLGRDLRRNGW